MRRPVILAACVLLSGCAAATPSAPSPNAASPTAAPVASAAVTASPPPTAAPSAPSTPRPTAGAFTEAAPNGTTVAAFAGSWVGDTVLPAYNQPAETVWNARLSIVACAVGDSCGEFHIATKKAAWSGNPESCDYAINLLGYKLAEDAFVFGEKVIGQSGHKCYTMLLYVNPLAGGTAIAVQEIFNGEPEDAGILRRAPGG